MKEFGTFVVAASILLAAAAPSIADVITVDGGGGGDYLTIQEAVDSAAPSGDTVLVYPGIYTDLHETWGWGLVNVYCSRSITLLSSSGPEVTILDGGGVANCGVFSDGNPVVVEGFAIRNGCSYEWYCSAVSIPSGEVRGNVCSGYGSGVGTVVWWNAQDPIRDSRDRDLLTIDGNTLEHNVSGVHLANEFMPDEFVVSGNIVSDNSVGVYIDLEAGSVLLVGNTISANTKGVEIHNGSFSSYPLTVDLEGNGIFDNAEMNIGVRAHDSNADHSCKVTIGSSIDTANDIHGSPVNLRADIWGNLQFTLDATYNYWGSIVCTTLVPHFDIDIGGSVPDSAFSFEPFLDETHTITYDCQGVPVQNRTWGSIKSLYR